MTAQRPPSPAPGIKVAVTKVPGTKVPVIKVPGTKTPGTTAPVTTAPAEWPDVERLFGVRGEPSRCWCRFFALSGADWRDSTPQDRKAQLREKFDGAAPAPGILAFRAGEPVGWCAVEPRDCYPRILRSKVLKSAGRAASRHSGDVPEGTVWEGSVWSVTCFIVSPGHRRSGVAGALLRAAVGHAFAHGAAVVEGYPVDPASRPKAGPADLYQGTLKLFLGAGFDVVSDAVPGRAVVRLWHEPEQAAGAES